MKEPKNTITPRATRILEAVIQCYLSTGRPVGSRTVVRLYKLDCSPATVRNEMADLAEMGYLKQTHISSGRVPTDKCIRLYLDYLLREDKLSLSEMEHLRGFHPMYGEDFRSMLRSAGRTLADLTRQAGVVLMPGLRQAPMRSIEFVRLTAKRVMSLLVSERGRFHTRVFEWGEELKQSDLKWASNYLNERFQGKTLSEIRKIVIREMREEKAAYNKMLAKALGLMETVLEQGQLDEEVFIEGRENLVEKPEFAETEKMVQLLKTFEEKSFLMELLSRTLEGSSPVVLLSSETGMDDIPELAIIAARCGVSGPGGGTVGIIGPTRMNYARVIPMVRCTARYVSDLLKP